MSSPDEISVELSSDEQIKIRGTGKYVNVARTDRDSFTKHKVTAIDLICNYSCNTGTSHFAIGLYDELGSLIHRWEAEPVKIAKVMMTFHFDHPLVSKMVPNCYYALECSCGEDVNDYVTIYSFRLIAHANKLAPSTAHDVPVSHNGLCGQPVGCCFFHWNLLCCMVSMDGSDATQSFPHKMCFPVRVCCKANPLCMVGAALCGRCYYEHNCCGLISCCGCPQRDPHCLSWYSGPPNQLGVYNGKKAGGSDDYMHAIFAQYWQQQGFQGNTVRDTNQDTSTTSPSSVGVE